MRLSPLLACSLVLGCGTGVIASGSDDGSPLDGSGGSQGAAGLPWVPGPVGGAGGSGGIAGAGGEASPGGAGGEASAGQATGGQGGGQGLPGAAGAGGAAVAPGGGAGAGPVQEGSYEARLHEDLFPRTMACGERFAAYITYENTGTATWQPGLLVLAPIDGDPLVAAPELPLDREVPPGALQTFWFELVAPATDASYPTDWQLRSGAGPFGEVTANDVLVQGCGGDPGGGAARPLPDVRAIIDAVHASDPSMILDSCQSAGGSWRFLDAVVDRLRQDDDRWGYNWKRGNVGDPSQDAIDYHFGDDAPEGSTEVYIVDVITGHCGPDPRPGFLDQTEATRQGGTIGRWTGRGRF